LLQNVLAWGDPVVASSAQVSLGQVCVGEQAAGKIGAREVGLGKISFAKIDIQSRAIPDLDLRQNQPNERGMADSTRGEANWIAKPGCSPVPPSPVDADQLGLFEACAGEDTARYLDETQITTLKVATDEFAGPKDTLREGTTNEGAVVKLTGNELSVLQVYSFKDLVRIVTLRANPGTQVQCPLLVEVIQLPFLLLGPMLARALARDDNPKPDRL
jgi:hypothetical protein